MEISPRRSSSLDYDASVLSPAATCLDCRTDMYTLQGMKSAQQPKAARPFALAGSLSLDSSTKSMLAPKKENFFSSIFNALTNVVMDRIAKVPGSFMTNINSTLSVTVVPNEGIISQDFFKTLTRNCEQLSSSEHGCDTSAELVSMPEKMPSRSIYDPKSQVSYIFAEIPSAESTSAKLSFDFNRITQNGGSAVENELGARFGPEISQKGSNKVSRANEPATKGSGALAASEGEFESPDWPETNAQTNPSCYSSSVSSEVSHDNNGGSCATGWRTALRRVAKDVASRLSQRSSSPDAEVPSKKPNLATYPHQKSRRRLSTLARVRCKGRGKSQLRRSGVSQSRHRKERTKQNVSCDIRDDLEAWEDMELNDSSEEASNQGAGESDQYERPGRSCGSFFVDLSLDSTFKQRKRKQGTRDRSSKCPVRVRYVPESSMEVDDSSCTDEVDSSCKFRPRLVSECSVESEDSYCIVFENSSDSESSDSESEDEEEEDEEVENRKDEELENKKDEELENKNNSTIRVRFNLKPQVHKMVTWDYAYRAARPGPWEQMMRDRVRFRKRIREIEPVLEPILSPQHRKCVWQNRFDLDG